MDQSQLIARIREYVRAEELQMAACKSAIANNPGRPPEVLVHLEAFTTCRAKIYAYELVINMLIANPLNLTSE